MEKRGDVHRSRILQFGVGLTPSWCLFQDSVSIESVLVICAFLSKVFIAEEAVAELCVRNAQMQLVHGSDELELELLGKRRS